MDLMETFNIKDNNEKKYWKEMIDETRKKIDETSEEIAQVVYLLLPYHVMLYLRFPTNPSQ